MKPMDKPNLCSATWMKDHKDIQLWTWQLDEENKVYINIANGQALTGQDLYRMMDLLEKEGWQLCRRVI